MRRPALLYLPHRIPYPPDKGDKIRSFHLLNTLARIGEVDLVTHADDPRDLRHVEVLRESCRSVTVFPLPRWRSRLRAATAIFTGTPLSVAWMTRGLAGEFVRELLAERTHDAIVVCSSQGMSYLPANLAAPVILDAVDVDSEKWTALASGCAPSHWIAALESRRMRRFERASHARSARVVLSTEREAALWRKVAGSEDVLAITNGVALPASVVSTTCRQPGRLMFCGAMDYEPNVRAATLAATKVLPAVQKCNPSAHLVIVGRNPTESVRGLAALPGVSVTGEVPDIAPHLQSASVALIPLEVARGIQNKVLEAMAHGVPVVTTPAVASSLDDSVHGTIAVASVEQMAAVTLQLLADEGGRARLAAAGRAFVAEHHSWSRFDAAFGAVLRDSMAGTAARSSEVRACR